MRLAAVIRFATIALVLNAKALPQSAQKSCPADRPVDDFISEMKKQEKVRNKQLSPETYCVLGWCRQVSRTPPTVPQSTQAQKPANGADYSSSTSELDKCDMAMELAIEAAHDVEVGDYNAKKQNLRGALMRYQDALEKKLNDAAIQVRLGRTYEKLGDVAQAKESYTAALKLSGPDPWMREAKSGLARLEGVPTPK